MNEGDQHQASDGLIDPAKPKDSSVILDAISHAEKEFRDYNEMCRRVDNIYSAREALSSSVTGMFTDQDYDTFWASMEILKPAIYAKAPQVIAKPRFSDATATDKVVAELIERVVNSEFERNGIDMHLREVRDDLALNNRGVLRVTYEAEGGEKRICVDHVDRLDFLHEPVRYWPELGWEAVRAWMTEKQMAKRFKKLDPAVIRRAGFVTRQDREDDEPTDSAKAPVWEVWSKTDNKVYWVTEGIDVILDEVEPHLSLRDFFPCPRPAYGTTRRRTLIPIPDYVRYASHLDQINVLTSRIYTLLDRCRVQGLVPAGGDISEAIQTAMASTDDMMLIPVPGAAMQNGGEFVQWLPIDVIANTITGLITARTQLFSDFDRLSGISDIMRGETEAQETLGAQRIKTQYGSVRVKDKTEEIVRLARDVARVAVEIICDKFDKDTLLEISQMTIPSKRDVEKDLAGIKKAAGEELKALTEKAKEAAQQAQQSGQQVDPAQAQQMFQQGQQQIAEKYAPDLQRLANTVVIEDVMDIIKDKRDRALVVDIETDSTVMVDEMAEKQASSEMLQAVTGAFSAFPQFAVMGEQGVKFFGAVVNHALLPFTRGNRVIQSHLDELIENAPEIAEKMQAQQGDQGTEELAKAQQTLADAEMAKAQAAMKGVEAKAQLDQATSQIKIAELQGKQQDAQTKAQQENDKLQLQLADATTKAQMAQEKQQADIDYLTAQTAKILNSIGLDERKQQLSEYQAASNEQARVVDQQQQAVSSDRDAVRADRSEDRADRGQQHSEATSERDFELRSKEPE